MTQGPTPACGHKQRRALSARPHLVTTALVLRRSYALRLRWRQRVVRLERPLAIPIVATRWRRVATSDDADVAKAVARHERDGG